MSSSAPFSLDLLSSPPSEKLCYVHCSSCDTVLAVSVPYSSLFKTVTVRCGHCANLLSVNMRALLLPSINSQLHHLSHPFLSPELEEQSFAQPNLMPDNSMPPVTKGAQEEAPQNPVINRPPEKRQRVPSAYNRFIKDEIQRIKVANPDISHREAFSAAAKNWAHFPHIQFGLMPDEALKNTGVHPPVGTDLEDGFLYGGQLSSFSLLGAENCMS